VRHGSFTAETSPSYRTIWRGTPAWTTRSQQRRAPIMAGREIYRSSDDQIFSGIVKGRARAMPAGARCRTTGNVYDGRNYVQPSRISQVVAPGADRGDHLQRRRLSQSPEPAQRSHRLVDHAVRVHGRQQREAQDLRRVQDAEGRARSKHSAAPPTVRVGPGEGGVRPGIRLDRARRPARRRVWERVEPATPEEQSLGEPPATGLQRPPSSDPRPADPSSST
jgi:hypothetical protein